MDNESCGTRCVQFILFMLNFIFFLCGIGLVVISIFIWIGPITSFNFNVIDLAEILGNEYLKAGCFIMLGTGIVVIFFSIIGCCGAFLLSRLLLGIYFLIVILLFFAQLAGAVLAAIYSAEVDSFLASTAKDYLQENYKVNGNDSYTAAIDRFQNTYECCGIETSTEYELVPDSCCPDPKEPCNGNIYTTGCKEALKDLLTKNTTIIGATLVGVACLELFLMVFAVLLCRNASEKDDY